MDAYRYSLRYNHPVLAELYDRSEAYDDDVQLIRSLIGDAGPLTILEPFCGTGRIIIPLILDGHRVTGIDLFPAMVDRARSKLAAHGPDASNRANLRVVDVLDTEWGTRYDVVVMGGNAFYELPSAEAQDRCVARSRYALRPGGHVYIDNNDYKGDWDAGPFGHERVIFEGIGADGTYLRATLTSLSFEDGILHMKRRMVVRTPDGQEHVDEYLARKHPCAAAEVRTSLLRHGFTIENEFGHRDGSAYTPESGRAIFWATR